MFYTVPGATPLLQLMNDALILAHSTGHDVFNALDIFENEKVLKGECRTMGCWQLLRRLSLHITAAGAERRHLPPEGPTPHASQLKCSCAPPVAHQHSWRLYTCHFM